MRYSLPVFSFVLLLGTLSLMPQANADHEKAETPTITLNREVADAVEFTSGFVVDGDQEKKIRVCAGAIPDTVHSQEVEICAYRNGAVVGAGVLIIFRFDTQGINYTGAIPPRFIVEGEATTNPRVVITDADGKAKVTVQSSNQISKPYLVVLAGPTAEIGRIRCDFGSIEAKTRYGIISRLQGYDEDKGWDFDPLSSWMEGDVAMGVVYAKFRKNDDERVAPVDRKYFRSNGMAVVSLDVGDGEGGDPDGYIDDHEYEVGQERGMNPWPHDSSLQQEQLDDHANWLPVASHHVRVRIKRIVDVEFGEVAPEDFPLYASFCNEGGALINRDGMPVSPEDYEVPSSVPILEAGGVTDANGRGHIYLLAGPWRDFCARIEMEAGDSEQLATGDIPCVDMHAW